MRVVTALLAGCCVLAGCVSAPVPSAPDTNSTRSPAPVPAATASGTSAPDRTSTGRRTAAGATETYVFTRSTLTPAPPTRNETAGHVWTRTFGGSGNDVATSVIRGHDDGFLATGRTNGSVWAVNVDGSGGTEWQRTYGDGVGVAVIPDGSGYVLVADTPSGVRLLKIASSGETRWSQDVTTAARPTSIVRTAAGAYVIGGSSNDDGWLLKTTDRGVTEWSRTFGGKVHDEFRTLAPAPDGGVVAAGYSDSGPQSQAPWVLHVNRTGAKEWERVLGSEPGENAGWGSSIVRVEGGYALAGYRAAEVDGIGLWRLGTDGRIEWARTYARGSGNALVRGESGYAIAGTQTAEVALVTTDRSGTFRSFVAFKYAGSARGHSIASAGGGEYVVAGRYDRPFDDVPSDDAVLLRLDAQP